MCTAQVFSRRGQPFALKFYVDVVVPINHSWHQKTRDIALNRAEDRMPLRSLNLTQYNTVV